MSAPRNLPPLFDPNITLNPKPVYQGDQGPFPVRTEYRPDGSSAPRTQRLQYPLIKESSLNHIRDPTIIEGIFSIFLESLGSRGERRPDRVPSAAGSRTDWTGHQHFLVTRTCRNATTVCTYRRVPATSFASQKEQDGAVPRHCLGIRLWCNPLQSITPGVPIMASS